MSVEAVAISSQALLTADLFVETGSIGYSFHTLLCSLARQSIVGVVVSSHAVPRMFICLKSCIYAHSTSTLMIHDPSIPSPSATSYTMIFQVTYVTHSSSLRSLSRSIHIGLRVSPSTRLITTHYVMTYKTSSVTGEVAGHRTRRHLSTAIFFTLAACIIGDPGELGTVAFSHPRWLPQSLRTRCCRRGEG